MKDCTEGTSAEVIITRKLANFDKIRVSDRFDVVLIQDSVRAGELELFGPPEITGGILTKSENGQFTVRDDNRCKWLWQLGKRLKIHLYFKELSHIEILGNASIFSQDTLRLKEVLIEHRSSGDQHLTLDIDRLFLDHREGGTFFLYGRAGAFVPTMYETGRLEARTFLAEYLFIYHYGINRADVLPGVQLVCRSENKGNTYYYNEPSWKREYEGRGPGILIRAF